MKIKNLNTNTMPNIYAWYYWDFNKFQYIDRKCIGGLVDPLRGFTFPDCERLSANGLLGLFAWLIAKETPTKFHFSSH